MQASATIVIPILVLNFISGSEHGTVYFVYSIRFYNRVFKAALASSLSGPLATLVNKEIQAMSAVGVRFIQSLVRSQSLNGVAPGGTLFSKVKAKSECVKIVRQCHHMPVMLWHVPREHTRVQLTNMHVQHS